MYTAPTNVPVGEVALHRKREQFWQSRFSSRVKDGGYNDIRVIRQKSRAAASPIDPRIFAQREYSSKAANLLRHWIAGSEQLSAAHFADYGDSKLLHFVELWSMSPPNTPAFRLCRLLLSVLADRHRDSNADGDARHAQTQPRVNSVVLTFSSYLWDQFPLSRLLDDKHRRDLLPPMSWLRDRVFAVRLKYTRPLKLLVQLLIRT